MFSGRVVTVSGCGRILMLLVPGLHVCTLCSAVELQQYLTQRPWFLCRALIWMSAFLGYILWTFLCCLLCIV